MPDGEAEAHLATAPGGAPAPGVLFVIDAIGLRPRIEEMADRIASWGYTVLAPNVFYRDGSAADVAPKADLREPGNREAFMGEAMQRVRGLTPDLLARDLPAYLAALRSRPEVAGEGVGVTGYCMGARIAIRAAGIDPGVVAVGGWHGGGLVTDDPDSPHLALATARAGFAFGHASNDGSMPPEAVEALGAALAEAGLDAVNEVFPGPHGYSMSDTAMYDEESAERHFASLRALLDARLRNGG
jgi:carboxymethylenebutenolidase